MTVSGNVWRSGQTLCRRWLNNVTGPGYLRIDEGKPGAFLPVTVPLRSFIPQQAVYVSAPFTAPVISDCQVSQKQYQEHQHRHRIPDQSVLREKRDKAKDKTTPSRAQQEYAPVVRAGMRSVAMPIRTCLQSSRTGHFARNARTRSAILQCFL